MEILKNYIKSIKKLESEINKSNDDIKIDQYRNEQISLTNEIVPIINELDEKVSKILNNKSQKEIHTEKDLENKKVYFLHRGTLPISKIKSFCNIVKSPKDADIIIIHYINSIYLNELNFNPEFVHTNYSVFIRYNKYYHYVDTDYLKPALINKYYEISQNPDIQVIPYDSIVLSDSVLNKFSKEVIPPEVQQSIIMMLKSNDQEMFNLGWKTLWQYDYEKNKDQILIIYCQANRKSLYDRVKSTDCEYCYKNWKKYWEIF